MKVVIIIPLLFVLSTNAEIDFEKDIKPIFEARCVKCHGAKKQKGKFALHTAKDILKVGESEEVVIVKGKPEKSLLYNLVSDPEDDSLMPPKGKPLTKGQIAKIKKWISEGAKYPSNIELKDKSSAKK